MNFRKLKLGWYTYIGKLLGIDINIIVKVIPHDFYDLQANKVYVSIGTSSDTADFVIDNLLMAFCSALS